MAFISPLRHSVPFIPRCSHVLIFLSGMLFSQATHDWSLLIVQVLRVPGLTSSICLPPGPLTKLVPIIVQRSNLSTPVYSQLASGCLCVASPELRTVCGSDRGHTVHKAEAAYHPALVRKSLPGAAVPVASFTLSTHQHLN